MGISKIGIVRADQGSSIGRLKWGIFELIGAGSPANNWPFFPLRFMKKQPVRSLETFLMQLQKKQILRPKNELFLN